MYGFAVVLVFQKQMVPFQWLVRKRWPSECQHMERRSVVSWVGRGGEGRGGEGGKGSFKISLSHPPHC